jgi:hypothetical protein
MISAAVVVLIIFVSLMQLFCQFFVLFITVEDCLQHFIQYITPLLYSTVKNVLSSRIYTYSLLLVKNFYTFCKSLLLPRTLLCCLMAPLLSVYLLFIVVYQDCSCLNCVVLCLHLLLYTYCTHRVHVHTIENT